MIISNLIVGDNAVIPIDEIEAAIGSEFEGDGSKHGIATSDEVLFFFELVDAIFIEGVGDGVDRSGDGVGYEVNVLPRGGEASCGVFRDRDSAESGAAKFEVLSGGWVVE